MAALDSVHACDCETALLQLRFIVRYFCCVLHGALNSTSAVWCLHQYGRLLVAFIGGSTAFHQCSYLAAERARRPIMVRVSSVRSDRSVGRSPHHKHLSASWMELAKEAVTFITACPRRRPLLRGNAYWVVEAPATAGCGFTWMVTPLVSPLTISGCDASV